MDEYAPLWCKSNFSFLEGASHAEELVEEAHRLGIALDRDHRSRRRLRHGPRARQGEGARRPPRVRRADDGRAAERAARRLAGHAPQRRPSSRRARRARSGLGRRHR